MTDILHGLCLSLGTSEDGWVVALCSDGSPQRGDTPVTVLSVRVVGDEEEAWIWFQRMKVERPWETRQ